MKIDRIQLEAQPYLYVERECAYGPGIADAMASAFGEMFTFLQEHRIEPASMPISVYLGMDPQILRFRGGFLVAADQVTKAADKLVGNVKAAELPAGVAMTTTHVGSYALLGQTHGEMEKAMEAAGTPTTFPIWEHYVDDPDEVEEANMRTEIFRMID